MNRLDPAEHAPAVSRRLEGACDLPLDLHAYCFLPGHFHLLVRAEAAVAEEASRRVQPCGLRPRITSVGFGRHLMEVSRYIHLNPVQAGLAWRPEDWPYSSFRAYLGQPAAPAWLTTGAVLGRFGTIGARHRHRAYVYEGLDPGTRDANGRPRWDPLFGEGSVMEDLAWRIEPVLAVSTNSNVPERRTRIPPLCLAREIAVRFDVPLAALRAVRGGGPRAALARGAMVHEARARGGYQLATIAAWMGYRSPYAAAAAAERYGRTLTASSYRRGPRVPPPAPSPSSCRPSDTRG
jgi:hypothetical protein